MSNYNNISRRSWSVAVVVVAALIFTSVILVINCSKGSCLYSTATPSVNSPTDPAATLPATAPGGKVVISFYTSDTKANWIKDVTADFNEARLTISSGQEIAVEVIQGDSGDLKDELLAGQIQPTVFSPSEMSWVNEVNAVWQQHYNKPLVQDECPPTVIAAIGFGMWKPMAEAMGWPDKPIGWTEMMALANDPEGWGRYGHPEWGQFKFGHTHPLESNTGRLAILSLAYWALGQTDGLTPELVKSEPVVTAVRQLESRTSHYGGSTRWLFARMVELGPAYLHAGTTSETNLLITNL